MSNTLLEKFLVQPSTNSPKRAASLYTLAKKHTIRQADAKKETLSSSVDTIVYGVSK